MTARFADGPHESRIESAESRIRRLQSSALECRDFRVRRKAFDHAHEARQCLAFGSVDAANRWAVEGEILIVQADAVSARR